jgi:predicted DNA-binding transcriptional regulator AlpA
VSNPPTFIRVKPLGERFGVSVRTIWRWVRCDPTFPRPIKFSAQVSAWDRNEIDAWELDRKARRAA